MNIQGSKVRVMMAALVLFLVSGIPGPAQAAGDESAELRETLETCFTCHGDNGASTDANFPILAGQHYYYLYVQMKDFKAGRRASAVMEEFVAILSKDDMKALAKFFSEQSWPNIGYRSDPELASKGQSAAVAGQCVQCHLGSYVGSSRIPRVAGQFPQYLKKTMMDFKTKQRMNSPAKSSLMSSYSAEDIAGMADFMAGM